MSRIVFVDCETTGLDPRRHVPWEIGMVGHDHEGTLIESSYLVQPTDEEMSEADPGALRISRFYERARGMGGGYEARHIALGVARFLDGATLAGNVVSFDAVMLDGFLRRHGQTPTWHYHLLDVEAFAAGALGLAPPWNSKAVSEALGVTLPGEKEIHTALGDARWSRLIYEAALSLADTRKARPAAPPTETSTESSQPLDSVTITRQD